MDSITLDIAGAKVTLPPETLTNLWLSQLQQAAVAVPARTSLPALGTAFRGGIFAGIARGRDGHPDYYLIVADAARTELSWEKAKEWAKNLLESGYADYALPTRAEQALLFANVPELFEKAWYWSGEQSAGDEQSAWCQDFGHGYQTTNHKTSKLRARAVRRQPIE